MWARGTMEIAFGEEKVVDQLMASEDCLALNGISSSLLDRLPEPLSYKQYMDCENGLSF